MSDFYLEFITFRSSPLVLILIFVIFLFVLAFIGDYSLKQATDHSFQFHNQHYTRGDQNISVGIAICYGLDGPGIESRWGARFSTPVQTGPGTHPASYTSVSQPL